MEIDESIKLSIKCFKCHLKLMGPLNIDYNASKSTFILWNKYEIFVYENFIFDIASKVFSPEFLICKLLSSNNLIVCLDFAGTIHTTSMKFKHCTQKPSKTNFSPREQSVLSCTLYTTEKMLSLKLEQDSFYLYVHNLNAEFNLEKCHKLIPTHEYRLYYKNAPNLYILKCYKLSPENCQNVFKIFDMGEDIWKDYFLIIVSFDRRSLYGCLYSLQSPVDEISLKKLHISPSEICDIKITETNHISILISLTAGTLIRISLSNHSKTIDIVHLNTAISKCVPYNDAIVYTDGITMWKTENTFTTDIKFKQFLVKQVKDFIRFGDQILCTTFTNLIYLLMLDDDTSYVKSNTDNYCEAGYVLNNSKYLHKILEEVERNDKIEKKIKEENNYITALSLSNRPDILDNVIKYSVIVYDNYEDVIKENIELTLTDNIKEYFINKVLYLLIKITLTFENHKIINVLLQVLTNLQIHITLFSGNKVIKTTSVRFLEELKNINILIPLVDEVVNSNIIVNIKIVKGIPGVLQKEQVIWTILHLKRIKLYAEHFIKSKNIKNHIIQMKEPESSIENAIHQIAYNCNGHLFKFNDISNSKKQIDEWSFYVKLPNNYEETFKNEAFYKERLNLNKALMLLQESTTEEFIKGKNNILLEIGNDRVKIEIINDGFSSISLKITSENMKLCFDIRNFYANLAYNNFKECKTGMEFIKHLYTLNTTIENIRKAVTVGITDEQDETVKVLLDQFQRDVFGGFPL